MSVSCLLVTALLIGKGLLARFNPTAFLRDAVCWDGSLGVLCLAVCTNRVTHHQHFITHLSPSGFALTCVVCCGESTRATEMKGNALSFSSRWRSPRETA